VSPSGLEELGVGESVVLAGSNIVHKATPDTQAVGIIYGQRNQIVVTATRPGDETVVYTDATGTQQSKTFRVVAHNCRDTPLNPALIIPIDGYVLLDVGELRDLDTAIRYPWVADAHPDDVPGRIKITGQTAGRTTIVATKASGDVLLWEVYVGGMCADKAYTAVAPAVLPGLLGPKGDGTCVRRDQNGDRFLSPDACPSLTTVSKLPDVELSPIACEWAASCQRQGAEGCCVGCNNPFSVKLTRACALSLLRATTCTAVQQQWSQPSCFAK
jgi:hypothetical protein